MEKVTWWIGSMLFIPKPAHNKWGALLIDKQHHKRSQTIMQWEVITHGISQKGTLSLEMSWITLGQIIMLEVLNNNRKFK